jgi:hypothetical protein
MGTSRFRQRKVFAVPTPSGGYANEVLTIGATESGSIEETYRRIQVVVEGSGGSPFVAGSTVEVWFPRLADATTPPSSLTNADYTMGGTSYQMTSAGMYAFELGGYSGCQVRVKSGGLGGNQAVSATAI